MANQKGRRVSVLVYNRNGNEYLCESIAEASEFIGVSKTTISKRLKDGYAIRTDNGATVRVRREA